MLIERLIDEYYWDELPDHIDSLFGSREEIQFVCHKDSNIIKFHPILYGFINKEITTNEFSPTVSLTKNKLLEIFYERRGEVHKMIFNLAFPVTTILDTLEQFNNKDIDSILKYSQETIISIRSLQDRLSKIKNIEVLFKLMNFYRIHGTWPISTTLTSDQSARLAKIMTDELNRLILIHKI